MRYLVFEDGRCDLRKDRTQPLHCGNLLQWRQGSSRHIAHLIRCLCIACATECGGGFQFRLTDKQIARLRKKYPLRKSKIVEYSPKGKDDPSQPRLG